eukprot:scaffold602_cov298-Pinguiococcus_pyrenoidosus.AAC.13
MERVSASEDVRFFLEKRLLARTTVHRLGDARAVKGNACECLRREMSTMQTTRPLRRSPRSLA